MFKRLSKGCVIFMLREQIAVVGDADTILAFKTVGIDIFPANTAGEATEQIKLLARNYSVIFITEDLAELITDYLAKFRARPLPAIIPIPSAQGSTGYGMEQIKANVERAVGVNILK